MVQTKKKTSEGKDFEKTKVKVGRAKPGAANMTDTSFKSRRLNVHEQALSHTEKIERYVLETRVEKDSLEAQLQPLLPQADHYNAQSRKEALLGILKLCKERGNDELGHALGPFLMGRMAKGMVDSDQQIRNIAILPLTLFLFERLGFSHLEAFFASIWLPGLFVALTHLDNGIRSDGLKFLQSAIKHLPILVLPSFVRLLDLLSRHHRHCLNSNHRKEAITALETAYALIDAYIKNAVSNQGINSVFEYEWHSIQRSDLSNYLLRAPPAQTLDLPSPTAEEANLCLRWIGEASMDNWLEALPLINSGRENQRASSPEALAYSRFFEIIKRLYRFQKISNACFDFRSFLPKTMTNHARFHVILERVSANVEQ